MDRQAWQERVFCLQLDAVFTRLRNLSLSNVGFLESSTWDALLQNNLRTLAIRTSFDLGYANFFLKRGSIPSLRTFDLSTAGEHTNSLLHFLSANTHLSMLSLHKPIPTVVLDTQLLPLVSNSFSKLTSLSLLLEDNFVLDAALEMISSLSSLQQIHLSAGKPSRVSGFRIDHRAMQKHLQKLYLLKKIAFSHDSYSYDNDWLDESSVHYYYRDKFLDDDVSAHPAERVIVWEQMHRQRMLDEANEYVRVMPQLEWPFFGQIQMGFEELPDTREKIAVALTTERDIVWTFLRDMFGVGTALWGE